MATLTTSGVGSGLDVNTLVSQLVAAERATADARNTRTEAKLTTQFTALAQLKGSLSAFQSALGGLKDADKFLSRKTTLSADTHLAASATAAAAPGSYTVEVQQLATAAQLGSNAVTGGATGVVGTGTLTISMGSTSFTVTLASPANTLADLRNAINSSKFNPGVTAALVTDVDGTHLVLGGNATGDANALRITTSGGDGGLAQFVHDPPTTTTNMRVISAAKDAIVEVSGYEIHDSDNSIEGAIEGVTLNLKKEEIGVTTSLTVSVDGAAIRERASAFVTAFNNLATQIAKLRSYNAESKQAGPMLGDSMLLNLESRLRVMVAAPVEGATGDYTTLTSLGISTTATGTLALDAAKFDAALAKDPAAVSRLFTTEDKGVASKLDTFIKDRLAEGGEIAARDASIAARRKDVARAKEALDARMVQVQARYMKQFQALDTMLSRMQSTSSYLGQQLANISNISG
jgi:flagellar hook-associated protein 2